MTNPKSLLKKCINKMASKPSLRRFLMLKLLLLAGISVMGVIYATFWLDEPIMRYHYYRRPQYLAQSAIKLQQNGDYWIYSDYIKGMPLVAQNSTITLTTHGTYMDFSNLELSLARWNAPVSLTLFASGDDFEATIQSLIYIKFCSLKEYFHYLAVHLVIHNKHFPVDFHEWCTEQPNGYDCNVAAPLYVQQNQNATYWHKHDLAYPINLMRNVARLNAASYFVLPIDTVLLPTTYFMKSTMKFLKRFKASMPSRTVYCVPIFPQLTKDKVPAYKSELFHDFYPYITNTNKRFPMQEHVIKLHYWLYRHIKEGEVNDFLINAANLNCLAYVGVNAFTPLYDQRVQESSLNNESPHLKLLQSLQYDFVTLDGTFLIKSQIDTWHYTKAFPTMKPKYLKQRITELTDLNTLALWFPHRF